MTKGQWLVTGFAAAFLLIIANTITWHIERHVSGTCLVTQNTEYLSPSKRYQVVESHEECPGKEPSLSIQVRDPNNHHVYSTILSTPSKFIGPRGEQITPVPFRLRWQSDEVLEIEHPLGVQLFVGDDELAPLSDVVFTNNSFYGLEVKFRGYKL